MGRPRNPIDDKGPIGQFAQRLRDQMDAALPKPTFRSLAARSSLSHSVLAEACAGKKMPTWRVTEEFVKACGADDAEVTKWREAWNRTQRTVGRLRRKLGEADVVVPTRTDAGVPLKEGRLRPVHVDLADPAASIPRPETAQTFDDLLYQVRVLKIAVGNPSLRRLQVHLRSNLRENLGASTMCELFSGQHHPTSDLYGTLIRGLLSYDRSEARQPTESWLSPQVWKDAWSRAEYNRVRPDLIRRRRTGDVYLLSENQDEGPIASIINELGPAVAAAMLSGLHRSVAAGILRELPPDKAQAVISAMWKQTGTIADDTMLPSLPESDPSADTDVPQSRSSYELEEE